MVLITADPINPSQQYSLISAVMSGSVVFHYAVVKEQTGNGKATTCIDYQFSPDAEKELNIIAEEIRQKWQVEDVLLVRRSGCLSVGDIISLVAASSPSSEDAFDACRYGISRLKKMQSVDKQEQFADTGKGES